MADQRGSISKGDLFPYFKRTLEKQNETTGVYEPIDLSNAETITLRLRCGGTLVSGPCTGNAGGAFDATGVVEYPWEAGDTDTPGKYKGQCVILWKNGKKQTVPRLEYFDFIVQEDLA
jgi:hypothetical protein